MINVLHTIYFFIYGEEYVGAVAESLRCRFVTKRYSSGIGSSSTKYHPA